MTIRSWAPSQASAMVPTRNSSSTGTSSGALSENSVGATAGTGALPPVLRTTSSRSSSIRSASAATWVFSRATLVVRPEAVACRKNVRWPG